MTQRVLPLTDWREICLQAPLWILQTLPTSSKRYAFLRDLAASAHAHATQSCGS
jgi:hypothetical protein